MNKLEIRPQPKLSIHEIFGMVLTTQRHRIFRSLVTILVVAVATAFMVNLGLDSFLLRKMVESTKSELAELRLGPGSASMLEQAAALEELFTLPGPRRVLAGMLDQPLNEVVVADAWNLFTDPRKVEEFNERIQFLGDSGEHLDVAAVVRIAKFASRSVELDYTLRELLARGQADEGASFRLALLLAVSLLVCVVGVANALLMAVTERSREIATLKCLGALDGTILLLFVLEASAIGLVGGFAGAALGFLLTVVRLVSGFGLGAVGVIDLQSVGGAFLVAVGLGVILATTASVYPSLRAARLAPMEAMRVD